MNRKTIVVAAAAGALAVSAGSAWALGTNGDPVRTAATPTAATSTTLTTSSTTSTTAAAARLTADDAARIVRARLGGGVVREVEAEFEHGRLEWKVQIVKDGVRYDIRVDAQTGDVTRAEAKSRATTSPTRTAGSTPTGRHGADDPAGDDRGGHGGDDPAGDDRGGHGADDPAGDDHGGHGGDDAAGDDHGGDR